MEVAVHQLGRESGCLKSSLPATLGIQDSSDGRRGTWAAKGEEQRVLNNARTLWMRFKERTRSDVVSPQCLWLNKKDAVRSLKICNFVNQTQAVSASESSLRKETAHMLCSGIWMPYVYDDCDVPCLRM